MATAHPHHLLRNEGATESPSIAATTYANTPVDSDPKSSRGVLEVAGGNCSDPDEGISQAIECDKDCTVVYRRWEHVVRGPADRTQSPTGDRNTWRRVAMRRRSVPLSDRASSESLDREVEFRDASFLLFWRAIDHTATNVIL